MIREHYWKSPERKKKKSIKAFPIFISRNMIRSQVSCLAGGIRAARVAMESREGRQTCPKSCGHDSCEASS